MAQQQQEKFEIGTFLQHEQSRVAKYAMREYDNDAFMRSVKLAVVQNPDLQSAIQKPGGKESFLTALELAATNGLSLNPQQGLACIIPRKGGIQYQVMKNGLIQLALESGQVAWCRAETVHENDEFVMPGNPEELVQYRPDRKNRGGIDGFFAEIKLKSGDTLFRYMTLEEVQSHKEKYSKNTFMSDVDYGEKTVMRKLLNKSAIGSDYEYSKMINVDSAIHMEKSGADQTYERLQENN